MENNQIGKNEAEQEPPENRRNRPHNLQKSKSDNKLMINWAGLWFEPLTDKWKWPQSLYVVYCELYSKLSPLAI